jgi:class 3 adenylate cyclase/PAS domain-containing protein
MADDIYTTGKEMEEKTLDAKQALKYAEDLTKVYGSLQRSEKRYRALFEYSPISLWEQDLSGVKNHINGLKYSNAQDLRSHLENNPEEIVRCNKLVKILDVNRSTLELYEAECKEDFSENLDQVLGKWGKDIIREELIAFTEGHFFELQCINHTLKGRDIHVLIRASIPPGYESTWGRVLISVNDLTERMRADFLKEMFGRYLSEEVMNTLLDNPDSVKLGGEKRNVTLMMTDLRGFTSISERLDPGQVIDLLNTYFEIMVDVLLRYDATINEITGDSILVIFGAPQQMSDRAKRAVACAIEMQNAMVSVNKKSMEMGLPEFEMGIGLNDAEVIVGNVGSQRRSKYGVVGSGVNMTSRIESYTVGGQILVSESVLKEAGESLRIDGIREVLPKGLETALKIYEVGGIGEPYNVALDRKDEEMTVLLRRIPLRYSKLGGKHVLEAEYRCLIIALSLKNAEIEFDEPLTLLTDLKMSLNDVPGDLASKHFYGKVIEGTERGRYRYVVRFTSVPPEIVSYFLAHRQHAQVRE